MINIAVILLAFAALIGLVLLIKKISQKEDTPDRAAALAEIRAEQWGKLNPQMVCPHCQTKGQVKTKMVSVKKGISGGKATAAILTGGVALVGGLSRKEQLTQAHCMTCNNTWSF